MPELTNDDRAEMVYEHLLRFRRENYFHLDAAGEPTEPLDTVLCDFLADLLHLADRTLLDPDRAGKGDADGDKVLGADEAVTRALFHYTEEVELEAEDHQ